MAIFRLKTPKNAPKRRNFMNQVLGPIGLLQSGFPA
jgi:hypothetical protein